MHVVLLALALVTMPQDTDTVSVQPDTVSGDSVQMNLAPTVDHRSLLGAALAGDSVAPAQADTDSVDTSTSTSTPRRPRAVEYSDAYYTRLHIHTLASYLTVPLFVTQYIAGQKLWNNPGYRGWAKDVHGPLAVGIGALFTVNTITGVWNLVEGNKNPSGRARRWIHGLSMLVSDAGFVAVGAVTPPKHEHLQGGVTVPPPPAGSTSNGNLHRNLAIASMGLALGSYLMMLLWKD